MSEPLFDNQGHPLPWCDATWRQRIKLAALYAIAFGVAVAIFVGMIVVLGMMMEGIGQSYEDRERCLKQAATGYEIGQCR